MVTAQLINKENRVVHLLASLPDSYNMLVTALEANADVAKMDVVKKTFAAQGATTKESSGS